MIFDNLETETDSECVEGDVAELRSVKRNVLYCKG